MATFEVGPIDRRMAIGGALVGAAGLTLPHRQSRGRVVIQRGMVGGGLARFEQGEASFSLFASRLTFEENLEVVAGSVIWVDASAGLTMASTAITAYNVPEDQPDQGQSRQIVGIMSVNGEGEHLFDLEVIDAGAPGTGLDLVILTVGEAAGTGKSATAVAGIEFSYAATGSVVNGDIQEINIEIDTVSGVSQATSD